METTNAMIQYKDLVQKYMNQEERNATGEFFRVRVEKEYKFCPGGGEAHRNELIIEEMMNGEWKHRYSSGMHTYRDAYNASYDEPQYRFFSPTIIEETNDVLIFGIKTGAGDYTKEKYPNDIEIYRFSPKISSSIYLLLKFNGKIYYKIFDPFRFEAIEKMRNFYESKSRYDHGNNITDMKEEVINSEMKVAAFILFEKRESREHECPKGNGIYEYSCELWKIQEQEELILLYKSEAYKHEYTNDCTSCDPFQNYLLKDLRLEAKSIRVAHLIGNHGEPTSEELVFEL